MSIKRLKTAEELFAQNQQDCFSSENMFDPVELAQVPDFTRTAKGLVSRDVRRTTLALPAT